MSTPSSILNDITHRPFDLPKGHWKWYQEWKNVLFLHWIFPEEIIRPLIPKSLDLDTIRGQCWVSLVAYSMCKTRFIFFSPIRAISDFHQTNLRTYVVKDDKAGIYLLHIDAQKQLSVYIAKMLS